ncbi:MAG: hypothetical protein LBF75_00070, partial [Treponema sp.]|nr:hypothetical protein [Treponema sp.]
DDHGVAQYGKHLSDPGELDKAQGNMLVHLSSNLSSLASYGGNAMLYGYYRLFQTYNPAPVGL